MVANADQNDDLQRLLQQAEAPEDDDPRLWTPPQVLALVVQYAVAVENLRHAQGVDWAEARAAGEDLLFLRDQLQDWLDVVGEDGWDDLAVAEWDSIPSPQETDARLEQLYVNEAVVRDFLHNEYRRFRDDVAPPRRYRWWWLDAELYGKRIH